MVLAPKLDVDGRQIGRVRQMCADFPQVSEKISHGEPTFFAGKRVFAMFADNHHGDGRIAVWLPVPEGEQAALMEAEPKTFFKPPYVGVKGWVGIELREVGEEDLAIHLQAAWKMMAQKKNT